MKTPDTLSLKLALMFLAVILAQALPALAVDFEVETEADTNDGFCSSISNPIHFVCSLREAIIRTNDLPGKDTIYLPPGTYRLTIPGAGEPLSATGDLNIFDDLDIVGSGSGVTRIVGDMTDNVFMVFGGPPSPVPHPTIQFYDLTISGGQSGVFAFSADLYLWQSVVQECGNTPSSDAVLSQDGVVLLADSVVRRNTGRAIRVVSGNLLMFRSTVADNLTEGQHAIECGSSIVGIVNSTIAGNRLQGPSNMGSGYYASSSTTTIDSCTFVGNLPWELGVSSSSGTTTIRNTYVHGDCLPSSFGHITSEGGNVSTDTLHCNFDHATDTPVSGDPLVMPLGYHGGYTPTMPPFGSRNLLVDNANADAHCQLTDQRGIYRSQTSGQCDIGAFERVSGDFVYFWGDGFETGDTSLWSSVLP
ncbi:MAG: choice-of-anchor Q domain-containing protein [Thermoanaerobaculales bacterium]|jgi:hypothetical protein|nr:choice-of-anchor Q domain-containing protein [Thermoanaerobaculales bacterium]